MRFIIRVAGVLIIVVGSALAYLYYSNFVAVNTDENKEHGLFIPQNATQDQVLRLLQEDSIIISGQQLRYFFDLKNYKGALIVPGKYIIGKG